jgi:glycosyltransferase involved in cell wall biosynthesis
MSLSFKGKQSKSVSLIITTYNWKEALTVVLNSVNQQTHLPDQVIVADDGSRDDTRSRIEELAKEMSYPLLHVHQPDDGFQVSRIRNRAIAASNSDYIISIDGDMMLHSHFIEDHLSVAKNKTFVQGGRVIMNEELTERILQNPKNTYDISFSSKEIKNNKNALWFPSLKNIAAKLVTNNLKRVRGCNQAFWRKDLVDINGFNEAFHGWGREDSDICLRLNNNGIDRINLKFAGIAYHLYHPEAQRTSLEANDDILEKAIKEKQTFCELGLDQYL